MPSPHHTTEINNQKMSQELRELNWSSQVRELERKTKLLRGRNWEKQSN